MFLSYSTLGAQNAQTLPMAVGWIERALLGTSANSIAILAVAILGLGMLWGRIDVRAAGRVILGAFILFGAPLIAYQLSNSLRGSDVIAPTLAQPPTPLPAAPQMPKNAPVNDPYAGAAVPQLQQ